MNVIKFQLASVGTPITAIFKGTLPPLDLRPNINPRGRTVLKNNVLLFS